MNDFAPELKRELLQRAETILPEWFPAGKRQGRNFIVGDLDGQEKGRSLVIYVDDGGWKDYATDESGGDLVSLYAAKNNLSQGDAVKALTERYGVERSTRRAMVPTKSPVSRDMKQFAPPPAPPDADPPGVPYVGRWRYMDGEGNVLYWVYRQEVDGEKTYRQFSWDQEKGKWQGKAYPSPRPLYNLPLLIAYPKRKVLLVEGEKCVDAAEKLIGDSETIAVTWSGGAQGIEYVDWRPLAGRRVTLWPDADRPNNKGLRNGEECMKKVAKKLHDMKCDVIMVDVSKVDLTERKSWDLADAFKEFSIAQLRGWLKKNTYTFGATLVQPASSQITSTIEIINPADETVKANKVYDHIWEKMGFLVNSQDKPIACPENAMIVLEKMGGVGAPKIWYDEFKCNVNIDRGDGPRNIEDQDNAWLRRIYNKAIGMTNISKDLMWDAILLFAMDNKRHPVREWFNSLSWDGVDRIEQFLHTATHCEDDLYSRSASKYMFFSIIARVYRPGHKVDNMVILEGDQGTRKSTLLESLVGEEYFTVINQRSFDQREYVMSMQGKLITEMGELNSFRTADIEAIKAFLSTRIDNIRRPYAKAPVEIPRQGVFVGSTNRQDYLSDPTGGRRFMPIRTHGDMDTEYAVSMRNQLFAEARHKYADAGKWWEMPSVAKIEQDARRSRDMWEDDIVEWLEQSDGHCTLSQIAREALCIDREKWNGGMQARIRGVLMANGWRPGEYRRLGKMCRGWVRPSNRQVEF